MPNLSRSEAAVLTRTRARELDAAARITARKHLATTAWRSRPTGALHRFYYQDLYGFIRDQVPPGSRVLDLGCGDGSLLASLRPSYGVGIDVSMSALQKARRQHPDIHFICADVEELPLDGPFDYIVVSNVVGYLFDVWTFFWGLSRVAGPQTRVILAYYNFLWEPLLKVAERLGLKSREPLQNWLSRLDLVNLLDLSDFEPTSTGYRTPLPLGPPSIARPVNRFLSIVPLVRRLGITSYVNARLNRRRAALRIENPTCTVVIPTRNEEGNIRAAVERLPQLGSHTEIIFVDGNSTDGTVAAIEKMMAERPDLDITLIEQGSGKGKGDAVRKGFEAARGDVLMILDADLTVAPEELPKFWDALVGEKGEFINGTRLVYPMEGQAMRLANIFGNKFFSIVFSWILDQRITDTLCGTKVLWAADYRRIEANRALFGKLDPFGDFDLLFGAANLGLKIREVPIRYRERVYGSTNIQRWRHGLLLLKMSAVGARRLRLR
jgi:SAM-dependent methyltransferase